MGRIALKRQAQAKRRRASRAAFDPLPRIAALTSNARTTWFTLLGVLIFVGVTLMGVEHIDFYGVNRATQLPLVSVSVPTVLFFFAAPLLTAAAYSYFHLYLIRLFDELGAAEAKVHGKPLGQIVTPWLVTDAALWVRAWRRGDGSAKARPLEAASALLNILLAWGFGLAVLGFLWWLSMPARDVWMTLVAGLSLLAAAAAGAASLVTLWRTMTGGARRPAPILALGAGVVAAEVVLALGFARTTGISPDIPLAAIDLSGEAVVEKPADWLPYQIERRDFRAVWCNREGKEDCAGLSEEDEAAFAEEWDIRRTAALAALPKPDLSGRDLRGIKQGGFSPQGANLSSAFLSGIDLSGARLDLANLSWAQLEGAVLIAAQMAGAVLWDAQMEGASLRRAQMAGAILTGAQMEGADLRGAQMEGASLRRAQMEGANLQGAQMEGAILIKAQMAGAILIEAQMAGANLRGAQMAGAVLWDAQMEGAILRGAQMAGANLQGAQMEGADLREAQMEGADLSNSRLTGTTDRPLLFTSTNLRASTNDGGALRFVDLSNAEFDAATVTGWQNSFGDGSVTLPDGWARPCQWADQALRDDAAFYGRWRGWIEANPDAPPWVFLAPEGFADVPADPPPNGCTWK